jgi:diketogulonate reductase-like aldo/keto reductase
MSEVSEGHHGCSSRRDFFKGSLGLAALSSVALAVPGTEVAAQTPGTRPVQDQRPVITRVIPKTKEVVPAIGLGTFMTFDVEPGGKRDNLFEVTRRYWQAGGRVIDTSPLYGMAEVNVGHFASALGINDQMFVSNKVWATGEFLGDADQGDHSLELSRERLWRDKIDLMQCHSLVNVDIMVPLMKAWKKEGRIKYLGVTHYETPYFEALADWVEKGDLDFVQVHYSIHTRQAEERILPAAADHGTAVSINMPLEKARLHAIVQGRPLPDFAKELEIETWSAFFLKWVISNPLVTVALPATTNPDHLVENMAALQGPLPDKKMRARMARHMETIPGFDKIAEMPWYPGKTFRGVISHAQQELRKRA